MKQYSRNLDNPYYFVKTNIVYNIGQTQDSDKCGQHLVTYKTEQKALKKGDKYYDLHKDLQTMTNDGNANVATEELNHTQNINKFPHFSITYKNKDEEDVVVYYYLQSLIEDGDGYNGTTFSINSKHGSSYVNVFVDSIKEDIKKYIRKGNNITAIKNLMPYWCFTPTEDEIEETINGQKLIFKSISCAGLPIADNTIQQMVIEVINEKTVDYAKTILNTFNYELKPNTTLITSSNTTPSTTEEIEEGE